MKPGNRLWGTCPGYANYYPASLLAANQVLNPADSILKDESRW